MFSTPTKAARRALLLGLVPAAINAASVSAAPIAATDDGLFGLYDARNLRLVDGRCQDCSTIPQALWYFQQEVIAVPAPGQPVAGFSKTLAAQADVEQYASQPDVSQSAALPPLVWLGSSKVIPEARLSADGKELTLADGGNLAFDIVPKIATNLSYYDASSLRFFSQRPLRLRGELSGTGEQFTARTIWPLDFALKSGQPVQALAAHETLQNLVRANNGGAQTRYATRTLWSKAGTMPANWAGKPVLGIMLNGAQGDDDEAHGGHFGIVSGRMEADGNWSRWLVNNFYNLDAYGEKGIIAAVTPMDKYMMDINNGQSFYRPSYMLVAVLKEQTVPQQYQAAINRVYNHFYRHDFVYQHAKANCAGISVDTLRSLGWQFPERGNGGLLKATAAYFYVAATTGSLHSARDIYDYITTEDTQLNPAAAFDAMGEDILKLANGQAGRSLTPWEQTLSTDIEALIYVHIPQIPSSRAFGQAPVYSFDEYLKRAPADRSQWKIIPVAPRPFPAELRDGLALQQDSPSVVPWPVAVASLGLVWLLAWFVRKLAKRKGRSI